MKGVRLERVQEEIRRELGEILLQKTRDPRLAWVTITRVVVSADLAHARVHVSALGDEAALRDSVKALVKAGPFLRSELGRGLKLRRVPEIQFLPDDGIRYSVHMSQLLRELGIASSPSAGEDTHSDEKGRSVGARADGPRADLSDNGDDLEDEVDHDDLEDDIDDEEFDDDEEDLEDEDLDDDEEEEDDDDDEDDDLLDDDEEEDDDDLDDWDDDDEDDEEADEED